jgi:MFS family permease
MTQISTRTKHKPIAMPHSQPETIGKGAYMALTAALLGWLFDGFEMGIFSQVGRQAIQDLLPAANEGQVLLWFNVVIACFLVGAATGGVIFGWLGDRIGRVRAMTLSVLTYAVFTGLCGLAADVSLGGVAIPGAVQLGLMRFIASIGMGGEWSLGVALVMEIWPNRSRAFMAGLIGAAANVGYFLVGILGIWLNAIIRDLGQLLLNIGVPEATVETLTHNDGWRLMLLMGTLPALLTFLIRIFVPESEKWEQEKEHGRTSHWQAHDLLGVMIGCAGPFAIVYFWAFPKTGDFDHSLVLRIAVTLVGLAIATFGFTWPVIRYLQRSKLAKGGDPGEAWQPTLRRMLLAAGLSGIALLGTWGSTQQAPSYASKMIDAQLSREAAESFVMSSKQGNERADVAKLLFKAGNRAKLADALDQKALTEAEAREILSGELLQAKQPDGKVLKMAAPAIDWSAERLADSKYRAGVVEQLRKKINAKEYTQIYLALGAIVGTIIAAMAGDWFGRRNAYCLLCALSLVSTWLLYIPHDTYTISFLAMAFFAGAATASFYGWLPLYLPELFRTSVRATGQGFSFNFGRVLAAIGALQTVALIGTFNQNFHIGGIVIRSGQPAACCTISLIYILGMVLIWFAPETKGQPLPE